MDDNTKNIITLCISGYAAVISTITLSWNIINSIIDKISIIKVKANFYTIIATDGPDINKGPDILEITILNKSKRIKYVKVPQLKLSYNHGWNLPQVKQKKNIINLYFTGLKVNFPIEMKPESEIILKYPLSKGAEWMYQNSRKKDCFRILITDTTEKKYKSRKIKIKRLRECVEYNSKIDQSLISQIIKTNEV